MSIQVIVRLCASTAMVLGLTAASAAAQSTVIPLPAVPSNLTVPAGHELFLAGHAIGTQNYMCLPSSRGFGWVLTGPQATLFDSGDAAASQISTHYLSVNPIENLARPVWQDSGDSSRVWGRARASSIDPEFVAPGAIPWLLVEIRGAQFGPGGGDALIATSFIQRLNTAGGVAPADGCHDHTDVGAVAFVPYSTDYFFFRPVNPD